MGVPARYDGGSSGEWLGREKLPAPLLAHCGLDCSHLRSMTHASPLRDSLVKLTARDMRAVRFEGSSSKHLEVDSQWTEKWEWKHESPNTHVHLSWCYTANGGIQLLYVATILYCCTHFSKAAIANSSCSLSAWQVPKCCQAWEALGSACT